MMHTPPQSDLQQREIVLLSHWLNQPQGIECCVFEVYFAVYAATFSIVAVASLCRDFVALVFPREYAASEGVVDDYVNTVVVACWDEFVFQRPSFSIVSKITHCKDKINQLMALYIP